MNCISYLVFDNDTLTREQLQGNCRSWQKKDAASANVVYQIDCYSKLKPCANALTRKTLTSDGKYERSLFEHFSTRTFLHNLRRRTCIAAVRSELRRTMNFKVAHAQCIFEPIVSLPSLFLSLLPYLFTPDCSVGQQTPRRHKVSMFYTCFDSLHGNSRWLFAWLWLLRWASWVK